MSKNNNVNPGQYKVAGRERQGEEVVHEDQKRLMNQKTPREAGSPNFIPGALPAGVSPKDIGRESASERSGKKKKD